VPIQHQVSELDCKIWAAGVVAPKRARCEPELDRSPGTALPWLSVSADERAADHLHFLRRLLPGRLAAQECNA